MVKYKILEGGIKPVKKTDGAACCDCYARLPEKKVLKAFESAVIPLGFCIEVPKGYYAEIRPRSGLTSKGIIVSIGTVDSDYRGEVGALMLNASGSDFEIEPGDRICQMMIVKIVELPEEIVDELSSTERGINGYGSTGKK